jgi:hypothetical protein
MGYLYNGEYEKAKVIYAQYKNEKVFVNSEEIAGKEIFLGDLRALAGVSIRLKANVLYIRLQANDFGRSKVLA